MTSISHDPQFVKTSTRFDVDSTPRTLVSGRATPAELHPLRQFVCWRYQADPDPTKKPTKIPVNPKTLGNAGVNWANTWSDIRHCVQVYLANPQLSGIGFVLTQADPYAMIDLDSCLFGGEPNPLASEVLDKLGTYAEISPSGRGLRLFVRCGQSVTLKTAEVEIYSAGRWATLTGNVYADNPIQTVADLDWLVELVKPARPAVQGKSLPHPHLSTSASDDQLWELIFSHNRLAYRIAHGDISNVHEYKPTATRSRAVPGPDDSRAVILLLNALAVATRGNAARMERMIRQCKGLDQSKFDRPWGASTWLSVNIADAIAFTGVRA